MVTVVLILSLLIFEYIVWQNILLSFGDAILFLSCGVVLASIHIICNFVTLDLLQKLGCKVIQHMYRILVVKIIQILQNVI